MSVVQQKAFQSLLQAGCLSQLFVGSIELLMAVTCVVLFLGNRELVPSRSVRHATEEESCKLKFLCFNVDWSFDSAYA